MIDRIDPIKNPALRNLWISKQSAGREKPWAFFRGGFGQQELRIAAWTPPFLLRDDFGCMLSATDHRNRMSLDLIRAMPFVSWGQLDMTAVCSLSEVDAAESTTFTHRKSENMRLEPMECEVVIPPRPSDSENHVRTLPPQKPAALTAPRPGEGHGSDAHRSEQRSAHGILRFPFAF